MIQQQTIDSRSGPLNLRYTRQGSGPGLVWGHSLMGSMRVDNSAGLFNWRKLEQAHTLVRYDARGHGLSDGTESPADYRWATLADDMVKVGRSQFKGPCLYGGVSMGCATALQAAIQSPEDVAGLILVLPPTGWRSRPRQSKLYQRLSRMVGLTGTSLFKLASKLPLPDSDDPLKRLAQQTMKGLADGHPAHLQAALEGACDSDMPDMDTLMKINVPTAIFAWYDDESHPSYTAEILARMLPDVREFDLCSARESGRWTRLLLDFTAGLNQRRAA